MEVILLIKVRCFVTCHRRRHHHHHHHHCHAIIVIVINIVTSIFQRAFNDFPSSLNLSSLKVNNEGGWEGIDMAAGNRRSRNSSSSSSFAATSNQHKIMSRADQGGVLEAVNLIMNRCDKDFIDRDLRRTGTSILLLTAGNGVLRVPPNITRLTQQVTQLPLLLHLQLIHLCSG
jgi:hypothetical protein